ncbi:MAG TPA: hypothetical protein VMT67_00165, partial [Terriglobales bacterium]|nr:hypothetical protein [Terriglobales bacterium]
LLAMTARPATDPDLWWHLRAGQWMAEHGRVAHHDYFSFTRAGSSWISHEWLAEIIFYELWEHAGPGGLIAFSSLVTTLGFLVLYGRCPGKAQWAAALTVLGATASAPSWGARPQMFTFLLASILLWLLERGEERPRVLLWIPPLFLLWLNLHGGFALGPALMALYILGLIAESAAGATAWAESLRLSGRALAITLLCLALVPLNPSGRRLYRYPLDTLQSAEMRNRIVEWFAPDFHRGMYVALLLIVLLLMVALAWSKTSIRGRVLLPLLFMTAAALDAVRHIPIFILLAIPAIAAAAAARSDSPIQLRKTALSKRATSVINASAVALLALFAVSHGVELTREQPVEEGAHFPQRAVTFLQNHPMGDRLFAYYDWGGYAIWKLGTRYRVFADGRADLYGEELLRESSQTVPQIRDGWAGALERWNVETVMVPPSTALAQALTIDRGWTSAYRDQQAQIFVRKQTNPDEY